MTEAERKLDEIKSAIDAAISTAHRLGYSSATRAVVFTSYLSASLDTILGQGHGDRVFQLAMPAEGDE